MQVIKLKKYLEIIVIAAVLSVVLASLKLAHGQSDNLTINQTTVQKNQTETYDSILMGVIKNANITIPSELHPTTQQLEQIADEIVNGGHPSKIIEDIRQNKS